MQIVAFENVWVLFLPRVSLLKLETYMLWTYGNVMNNNLDGKGKKKKEIQNLFNLNKDGDRRSLYEPFLLMLGLPHPQIGGLIKPSSSSSLSSP